MPVCVQYVLDYSQDSRSDADVKREAYSRQLAKMLLGMLS
jgi:hypothetical protein